jgi:hypothetical protein
MTALENCKALNYETKPISNKYMKNQLLCLWKTSLLTHRNPPRPGCPGPSRPARKWHAGDTSHAASSRTTLTTAKSEPKTSPPVPGRRPLRASNIPRSTTLIRPVRVHRGNTRLRNSAATARKPCPGFFTDSRRSASAAGGRSSDIPGLMPLLAPRHPRAFPGAAENHHAWLCRTKGR